MSHAKTHAERYQIGPSQKDEHEKLWRRFIQKTLLRVEQIKRLQSIAMCLAHPSVTVRHRVIRVDPPDGPVGRPSHYISGHLPLPLIIVNLNIRI